MDALCGGWPGSIPGRSTSFKHSDKYWLWVGLTDFMLINNLECGTAAGNCRR